MDLYQLRYFAAVVETGSFTRAAEECHVTQPTLSSGIKRLEERLGKPLFERSNRRVFLTEAGTRFLPRARAMLHEYNLALEVLGEREARLLRIGMLSTIPNRRVGALIGAFKRAVPDVILEMVDGTEQELLNRLDDRSIDYAISIDRGVGRGSVIPIAVEPYLFILPREHPLGSKASLRTEALVGENMIVRSRCELMAETSRHFTDHNVRPRLVYRTSNDGRAVAMVAAGLGSTVVPESWVDDRVSAVALKGFKHQRTIAVFCPHHDLPDVQASAGEAFEDFFRAHGAHLWADLERGS